VALGHTRFHRKDEPPPPYSGITVPEKASFFLIKTPKSRCFLLRTAWRNYAPTAAPPNEEDRFLPDVPGRGLDGGSSGGILLAPLALPSWCALASYVTLHNYSFPAGEGSVSPLVQTLGCFC
jgi:hypothetical protein